MPHAARRPHGPNGSVSLLFSDSPSTGPWVVPSWASTYRCAPHEQSTAAGEDYRHTADDRASTHKQKPWREAISTLFDSSAWAAVTFFHAHATLARGQPYRRPLNHTQQYIRLTNYTQVQARVTCTGPPAVSRTAGDVCLCCAVR